MIIDLPRFVSEERPYWAELDRLLQQLEEDAGHRLDLEQSKRFHYLYERASADLGRIMTFAAEPEMRRYLEDLVARAYAEIHETRRRPHRLAPLRWFFQTFPRTFRRHARAFWLAALITLGGALFGGGAVALDQQNRAVLLPFAHLQGDPRERVADEESQQDDRLRQHKARFSTQLMTHNTKVSILALALGMTYALGTIILLFYNGVILGAVAIDYALAGQTRFLLGWLLPHGAIEIPAILVAAQAGLVLGGTLIGRGDRRSLKTRLRQVGPDLVTLILGVACLLTWAGFVEAFFSQYHEPVLPYSVKILFGTIELALLILFLARAGAQTSESAP